jgi:hypothetical protein
MVMTNVSVSCGPPVCLALGEHTLDVALALRYGCRPKNLMEAIARTVGSRL